MKLRYTRLALAELDAAMDSIAADSPQAAGRVKARINAAIRRLLDFPRIGTRTDDRNLRRLTTPPYPYLVFYEVTEADIIIHAIRHAARDPAGMPDAE